jgi:ABC-2 type transport system ATP-binding protein
MLNETFQEVIPMICVSELTKTYGRTVAVDNISFEIPSGQIVGYLGPNGAGKSTTVKMLVGILKPAHGHVAIAGCDSQTDTIDLKRHIGYVPEDATLYETLTPVEYLRLVGQLYHMTENSIDEKTSEFLELFNLTQVSHQRISSLSKGMKQKVLIISAMLHNPDVFFLDEPFSNLDVSTVTLMKKILQDLAGIGKTVFYCTHILDVAETLCQRVLILNRGKLVADGSIDELREMTGRTSLEDIFALMTEADEIDTKSIEAIRVMTKKSDA